MEHAQKIFNSLVKNDEESAFDSFKSAITHKMEQAMEVKKVAVASEIFNQPVVEESVELDEAKLEKLKGSPLEIQNKLGTMIAKAKTIKGISDDEYMSWYSNLDDKTYNKWEKMVKADPQYKKAYKLGTQGGSDKPPFPKGTFAAAIWSNEYAAGAMDN